MSDPAEIKFTLGGRLSKAYDVIDLEDGESRQIWFLENLRPGASEPLPLLAAGVILRLRVPAGESGDSTVKLRPCLRTRLESPWRKPRSTDEIEYRIEEDWAGARHVLAASARADLPRRELTAALSGGADLRRAFNQEQRGFLRTVRLPIDFGGLTPLGPIAATRWKDVDIDGHSVVAERWRVGDLEFLEVSVRVGDRQEARPKQAALEKAFRRRGLELGDEQETKTRQVLRYLAASSAGPRPPERARAQRRRAHA